MSRFIDDQAGVDGAASADEAGDLDTNDPDLVEEDIRYDDGEDKLELLEKKAQNVHDRDRARARSEANSGNPSPTRRPRVDSDEETEAGDDTASVHEANESLFDAGKITDALSGSDSDDDVRQLSQSLKQSMLVPKQQEGDSSSSSSSSGEEEEAPAPAPTNARGAPGPNFIMGRSLPGAPGPPAGQQSTSTQSTGQRLQRPLIAFDAWLLALGR